MKRAATLVLIALLLLPAGTAAACPTFAGIRISDCDDDEPKPRRNSNKGSSEGASPSAKAEASLFRDLNHERARRGIRTVQRHWVAAEMARAHARTMARQGTSFHNPNLGSSDTRSRLGYPRYLAENVGHGPSVESIHLAYMRSADHRHNLLNGVYDHVGVGVVKQGRYYYAVEVFLGGARYASWYGPGPTGHRAVRRQVVEGSARVVRAIATLERMLPSVPQRIQPRISSLGAATTALPWQMMVLGLTAFMLPAGARRLGAVGRRRR